MISIPPEVQAQIHMLIGLAISQTMEEAQDLLDRTTTLHYVQDGVMEGPAEKVLP